MSLPDSMPDPEEYGRLPLASSWLAKHSAGEMDRKLTRAIREVVGAVTKLGTTGSVTLKLSVKQLEDTSVVITPDIASKVPQAPERSQHFYVDAEGYLAERDPYRQVLPFPAHDLTKD